MSFWDNHNVLESEGDYEKDAQLLEDTTSTNLYQHQRSLPRLPVPTLQDTIERFLPTALPLAESAEEALSLQQQCQDFLDKDAQALQERLLERAATKKDTSWLQHWWNTIGYLRVRDPVVINVSYYFQLQDDTTAASTPSSSSSSSSIFLKRAAAVLCATTDYQRWVREGTLDQETLGKQQQQQQQRIPLCSSSYKYMFNGCRIPQPEQDIFRLYNPYHHTHVVVAYRNQFYKVPLYRTDGNALSLAEIETSLEQVIELGNNSNSDLEFGWLTSWNRTDWALARQVLLECGMGEALHTLESGVLMLCLDSNTNDKDNKHGCWSYRQTALRYWHGGREYGGNRWFDKSIQLICTSNGKLGYLGEHSMMDGMPTLKYLKHLTDNNYHKISSGTANADKGTTAATTTTTTTTTTESRGETISNIFAEATLNITQQEKFKLEDLISKAKDDFFALVDAHELHVLSFQGYGASRIKQLGFSPDAYVQMAIQLATYRLFGKQVATYESTQVRPFLHGRTETTRSVSTESSAFVKAMGLRSSYYYNNSSSEMEERQNKRDLLEEATKSHVRYIRKAAQGQGVDRHFLGLSMLVLQDEPAPDLFSHPLFIRSKRWRVSTSTLPNTTPGFGPVVPDGVGIGYDIQPTHCIFTVTARREHDWTDRLCHLLEEALLEMELVGDRHGIALSKL